MSRERQLLSKAEQEALLHAYLETRDGPLRTRYQAVRLYGMGYAVDEILQVTGCSVSRLRAWYGCYQREGLRGLVDKRVAGNHRYLTPTQKADLAERLQLYTPAQVLGEAAATADGGCWTLPDVQQVVARWYNVAYKSLTSYRSLLQACGFTYQKSQAVFKSRKEVDVAEFSAALEKKADRPVARGTPHRDSGAR